MSGARLAALGPDFRTIMVESVTEGSAASESGLAPGDRIETVDDKTARDLSLQQIKQMFKQDGSQYLLGVRRGKDLIRLTIKIQRLI
jgi:C-terminal processing protease CtpA/Prc